MKMCDDNGISYACIYVGGLIVVLEYISPPPRGAASSYKPTSHAIDRIFYSGIQNAYIDDVDIWTLHGV